MSQTSEKPDGVSVLNPAPRFKTHDKQREVIQSDARYRICRWGRRAGKNVTSVIDLVEYARRPWASRWGPDDPSASLAWWVGPTYDQANKHGYDKFMSAVPDSWVEDYGESKPRFVEFINGFRVEFRTFDRPKSLQGEGVDRLIIDEADQMSQSIWYGDLEPMLMDTMGSALMISKPYRPQSWFHRFYDFGQSSDYPEYASWHATSADNPFLAENPEDKRGSVPPHIFEREYLAKLPEDGGEVFRDLDDKLFTGDYSVSVNRLYDAADEFVGEVRRSPADVAGPVSIGADFARSRDYRVTLAVDHAGELCYYHRARNEGWDAIEDHIHRVYEMYGGVVVPDASRDNKIVSDIAAAGIPVEPVKFSPKTKKRIIEQLATMVEREELTVPDVDALDQLHLELRQLTEDITASGYTRYHAPEGGYDDSVDSYALAVEGLDHAARTDVATTARAGGRDDYGDSDGDRIQEAVDQYRQSYRESKGGKW